jgi:hypothetical protein
MAGMDEVKAAVGENDCLTCRPEQRKEGSQFSDCFNFCEHAEIYYNIAGKAS